jgi:DNA-binding NarL/FixJ family response regulator
MKRVFLVEDHSTFRQAFAHALEQDPDIEVIAEAGSLEEARELVRSGELGGVDVAVLDILLPDGHGMQLAEQLHETAPGGRVLVLTVLRNPELRSWASHLGAHEVITKDAALGEIRDTIRRLTDASTKA